MVWALCQRGFKNHASFLAARLERVVPAVLRGASLVQVRLGAIGSPQLPAESLSQGCRGVFVQFTGFPGLYEGPSDSSRAVEGELVWVRVHASSGDCCVAPPLWKALCCEYRCCAATASRATTVLHGHILSVKPRGVR